MCNFMQTSVDRTGSQAYTVSHGRQTTPTKDSRKGYRTMNAVCFGMMMCMCMTRNENLQRDAGKPTSRFCLERKFVTMERGSVYKQPGVRM